MSTESQSQSKDCSQCQAKGLPILPVRYTVVPQNVSPGLPGWAGGDRVKDVALASDFQYALRTMRTGYFYLFYSKNARGSSQWECYAVGEDGSLILQPSTTAARPQSTPVLQCSRHGANNTQVHYIVIDKPDQCGPTWIAYSEHKWSEETVKEYETNTKLRNKRMQTIHPSQMAAGAKHRHGAIADKAVLEGILEYAPTAPTAELPYEKKIGDLSKEDGSFNALKLDQMSTRYPWHLRTGMAESTAKHMVNRGKGTGKPSQPHVLALWDAIGIAHELNGFRNDAAGWIKKYGDERELQIVTLNAIEGAKKALEDRAEVQAKQQIERSNSFPDLLEPREIRARRALARNPNDAAARKELEDIQAERQRHEDARVRGTEKFKQSNIDAAWPKYKVRLAPQTISTFKNNWDLFLKDCGEIIDRRTVALVHWLEAALFIDTLEDFHRTSATDGVLFEDCVGDAIFGMQSSPAGQKKIDAWIKEAKASVDTNLLWRAIALNQEEGVPEIDNILGFVYQGHTPLTSQAWANVAGQVKWNKVLDLAKKSLTAHNTQARALNDANSGIKAVANMRGLDKIFLTVGGRWLKPLTATVDLVNEVALRTMLMVRSGAVASAAVALGASDAVASHQDRAELIRRLKNQTFYESAAASAAYNEKAGKWAALRGDVEIPDAKRGNFNAARDARLALIVAVFEAYNLHKASAEAAKSPGNERVQAALTAAKCATAAAALDVVGNWAKALATAGDRAVSFQLLKLGGGCLSAIASGYGTALDWGAATSEFKAEDYRMAILYGIRGVFQATSAVLTSLTALSYCSPLIETFGKKFGTRMVGKVISQAAARLLLARAALVFASLEVSIFLLVLTVIIWHFTDDDLEKWLDRCPFGLARKNLPDAYKEVEPLLKGFQAALTGAE